MSQSSDNSSDNSLNDGLARMGVVSAIPSPPAAPIPPPIPPPPPRPSLCPVCREGIPESEEKKFPCNHTVHMTCHGNLINANDVRCPLCREVFACAVCKSTLEEGGTCLSRCGHRLHQDFFNRLTNVDHIEQSPVQGCNMRFQGQPIFLFGVGECVSVFLEIFLTSFPFRS